MNRYNNDFKTALVWIWIVFVFVILIIIIGFCLSGTTYSLNNFYYLGGIFSGLFTGLAFGGVLWTIYFQNQQAEQQKEESEKSFNAQQSFYETQLKRAEENIKVQKEVNNRQIIEEKIRRFETTLFNMLGLQQQIVNGLEYSANNEYERASVRGRQVFEYMFEDRVSIYTSNPGVPLYGIKSIISQYGLQGYEKSEIPSIFDHYFRHLYRIIKYIDDPKKDYLTTELRYNYITDNVRGVLSRYELIWIYYNCLSSLGNTKFKPLIEKYTLLQNLRSKSLPDSYDFRTYINRHGTLGDNFPNGDKEYFLTFSNENDISKYYIRAFYKEDELAYWITYYEDIKNDIDRTTSYNKNIKNNI
jgi:hypothetical protein